MITKKNEAFPVTQTAAESKDQERQRSIGEEDKLIDLALKWNYFDGVLPIFQARQSRMIEGSKHFIQVTAGNLRYGSVEPILWIRFRIFSSDRKMSSVRRFSRIVRRSSNIFSPLVSIHWHSSKRAKCINIKNSSWIYTPRVTSHRARFDSALLFNEHRFVSRVTIDVPRKPSANQRQPRWNQSIRDWTSSSVLIFIRSIRPKSTNVECSLIWAIMPAAVVHGLVIVLMRWRREAIIQLGTITRCKKRSTQNIKCCVICFSGRSVWRCPTWPKSFSFTFDRVFVQRSSLRQSSKPTPVNRARWIWKTDLNFNLSSSKPTPPNRSRSAMNTTNRALVSYSCDRYRRSGMSPVCRSVVSTETKRRTLRCSGGHRQWKPEISRNGLFRSGAQSSLVS